MTVASKGVRQCARLGSSGRGGRRGTRSRAIVRGAAGVRGRSRRRFFSRRLAQQVERYSWLQDWLGGAAMLLGVVSWGLLLALLAT